MHERLTSIVLATGGKLIGIELGCTRSEGVGGEEQLPLEDGLVLQRVSGVL